MLVCQPGSEISCTVSLCNGESTCQLDQWKYDTSIRHHSQLQCVLAIGANELNILTESTVFNLMERKLKKILIFL